MGCYTVIALLVLCMVCVSASAEIDPLIKQVTEKELEGSLSGITKFSDHTDDEFTRLLGLKVPSFLKRSAASDAPILPTNDLRTDFDWREKGAVSDVKNQGCNGGLMTSAYEYIRKAGGNNWKQTIHTQGLKDLQF